MSSFLKNVSTLSFGSIFAQFLGILAAPILTRLFAPEEFGIAGLFASIAGVIGVFSCLRYELAIMLPSNDDRAVNLLAGALILSIFISILSVILVFFAKDSILNFFNASANSIFYTLIIEFNLENAIIYILPNRFKDF